MLWWPWPVWVIHGIGKKLPLHLLQHLLFICCFDIFIYLFLLVLLLAIISHVSAKLGPITQCLKWERVIFASLPWGQVNTELIWRFPKIQTWNSPNLSEVTSSVAAQIDCLSQVNIWVNLMKTSKNMSGLYFTLKSKKLYFA